MMSARDLRECLQLQLEALSEDTPGKAEALRIVGEALERLPKLGVDGLAAELGLSAETAATGLHLVRSLDPRPGSQLGGMSADTYITPDCVIWRHNGMWRAGNARRNSSNPAPFDIGRPACDRSSEIACRCCSR